MANCTFKQWTKLESPIERFQIPACTFTLHASPLSTIKPKWPRTQHMKQHTNTAPAHTSALLISTRGKFLISLLSDSCSRQRERSKFALADGVIQRAERSAGGGYGPMWRCEEAWIFNLHLYRRLTGTFKTGSGGLNVNFLTSASTGRARGIRHTAPWHTQTQTRSQVQEFLFLHN